MAGDTGHGYIGGCCTLDVNTLPQPTWRFYDSFFV